MAKNCAICGNAIGLIDSRFKLTDGLMCSHCGKKLGLSTFSISAVEQASKMSSADVKEQINTVGLSFFQNIKDEKKKDKEADLIRYESILKEFNNNSSVVAGNLIFSDSQKEILLKKSLFNRVYKIYQYTDLTGCKPIVHGSEQKKHHGITRALVGGALLGGAGAIVGAVTGGKKFSVINELSLDIFFRDNSTQHISYISTETKTDSFTYRESEKQLNFLVNKINSIVSDSTVEKTVQPNNQVDNLRELKMLLDDGIITQADFDTKKKQLLGL
ncbi:DUF4428 domain-containing protein [Oenococcus sicerae]|uniref:DUF4428 domain-containing protein n=1 Tax=Oenococcus sicerae TaxID=2203724 RepID=A0ABX5QPB0_9LACO|nr:DUF4428 domain-containing protein [Oenococcus sicerae]QAS70649.2 DUF4428 domain-containing protein [Oenococcus sicerae]